MSLRIEPLTGAALAGAIPDLARLRVSVFAEWPYLYEGDRAYEERYLASYAEAEGAVIVVARDGALPDSPVVGAATGAPMATQPEEWRAPIAAKGYAVEQMFYCGESVLDPAYRGRGVGHAFFDRREAQARALGLGFSCFCGVIRAPDDPRRPAGARDLGPFWRKRGYAPVDGAIARFSWRVHGEAEESAHELQFWLRALEPRAREGEPT